MILENNMALFNRELSSEALDELKRSTKEGNDWWPDLLAHWAPSGSSGDLRLAIRNGYMNFYSNGQSIAKITFGPNGAPTLSIHHKYVIEPKPQGQKQLKLQSRQGLDTSGELTAWGGRAMLRRWIRNSKDHRGFEKPQIEALVASSPKVIDLEMGLPAFGDRKTALRMDIVALERREREIRIVFWEAKMIGDGRLRSKGPEPEVFKQIDAYKGYLATEGHKERVVKAYRRNCQLLQHMAREVSNDRPDLDPIIIEAAGDGSNLVVDENPRLIIFDTVKKRDENAWQEHLKVLRDRVSVAITRASPAPMKAIECINRSGG